MKSFTKEVIMDHPVHMNVTYRMQTFACSFKMVLEQMRPPLR